MRGHSAAASTAASERGDDSEISEDGKGEATSPREIAPLSTNDRHLPQALGIAEEGNPRAPKMLPVPSDIGFSPSGVSSSGHEADSSRRPTKSPAEDSFITARERTTDETMFTAEEDFGGPPLSGDVSNLGRESTGDNRPSTSNMGGSQPESSNLNGNAPSYEGRATSTTPLLSGKDQATKSNLSVASPRSLFIRSPAPVGDNEAVPASRVRTATSGVRFNIAEGVTSSQEMLKKNFKGVQRRANLARLRRNTLQEGAIVKMEKMLVRVDITTQPISEDYDENTSLKIETRMLEKWREFMVVIRQSKKDEADFRLQMYQSRVIPEIENEKVKKKPHHEVALNPKTTKVNLFSSLDKTVVIWHPYKKGTRIMIMRTRSTSHCVEWYTFLRDLLGWARPSAVQVNVPDLSVSLRLEKPFEVLEWARDSVADANDQDGLARTMAEEQAVAGKIIGRCIEMLQKNSEWTNVLDTWSKAEKMGLAWKRYDRLEWIHGVNQQKMYGSMAMQKSHDLELRPKKHYPTYSHGNTGKIHQEPSPVEGFLIQLTTQRGLRQRFGRTYFKRLYFSTHNQFLVFNKPSKVTPPHPPRLPTITGSNIPTANEILNETPTMFEIEPYPVKDGEISWLKSISTTVQDHDRKAGEESQRNLENLSQCDGYINLCRVDKVRQMQWGATAVDDDLDSGSDVDFHQDVADSNRPDGTTKTVDDDRTFELVLDNGLVVRLQAYDEAMMKEWITRLRTLVKYWKLRVAGDMNLFKMVRRSNLKSLNIDEEMEAFVGQFAGKWEVSRSEASPQLYHLCGISFCRCIIMSGLLYRKARRHATFHRCSVILANGALMVFQASMRKRTGEQVAHIHQEKQASINLQDCYIYSGLITEDDLLYRNRTFDSNNPGRHALPRVYLEDGWTSIDEDSMTCFVIWQGLRKSLFRAREEKEGGGTRQKLRQVSSLGVPGRSMVFQCRSRAERDHWVMNVGMEIDRLQQGEDVRLESAK